MKTIGKVEAFKNTLSNYRYYQREVKRLKEEAELALYNMSGVKGVDPGAEHGNSSDEFKMEMKLTMIDDYNDILEQLKLAKGMLSYIDRMLANFNKEDREDLVAIYADGHTYEQQARIRHRDASGLFYHLDKAIQLHI